VVDVRCPEDADVVVFQRVTHRYLCQAMSVLRAKGVTVVVDMDDDLSRIHPSNPAFANLHPSNMHLTDHSWENAFTACRDASLVTVSADALLRTYAPHGRGYTLRNCVPHFYLTKIDIAVKDRAFGWGGSLHSHPDDLKIVGNAVNRLVNESHEFRIVGPAAGVARELRLAADPPATGALNMSGYINGLATLRVGIAPLADTVFNAAKSWLKPLEYASVGVVPIVSPRVEYRRTGMPTASNPREWYRKVRDLLSDDALWTEHSDAARAWASSWTYETNAWRWAEAWQLAYEIDHADAPAHTTA
jgi:hypothetical protein